MGLLGNLFNVDQKEFHQAEKTAQKILAKETEYANKSDDELKAVTASLREELAQGKKMDAILPDAFAAAREASKRVIGQFPYPVQVLGGILLNDGDIAEMKTGEGKTLTAVMPIYLNALEGKGAHVITVNEYLADRDAKWMGDIYRFLGLSVGCNLHSLSPSEKREAYACDITYTTNSELGFDYLRDNMVMEPSQRVLRGLHYAVLDEVDSILIDEARTPLIISGPGEILDENYIHADRFVKGLKRDTDFSIDQEDRSASLTEKGIRKAEKAFKIENIYNGRNADLVHYIQNALRANYIMSRDVEYVVGDDEIILVDQFTGRKMEGREFSDGLHQAIQAKEGVGIKQETQTLATITYQNFFRLYTKLSGMTGTAKTEENEFLDTYNMRVFEVPTNRPIIRTDEPDEVFRTKKEKYDALINEIVRLHQTGQPVLVGTISVSVNELLSSMLKKKNIPHTVLNARNDENEAEIIAHAGQMGAITVATNMAGRGTDIKLGEGAAELGGLVVLGSERHEAKRIDNQLRGRSGRQGDPGVSRFYVSMEDDLMTQYVSEESKGAIEDFIHGKDNADKIRTIIDKTQERAVGLHYDSRKNTLEFDNVLMQQRTAIYAQRDQALNMEDIKPLYTELVKQDLAQSIEWDEESFRNHLTALQINADLWNGSRSHSTVEVLSEDVLNAYEGRMKDTDQNIRHHMEKSIFLQILDHEWIQHVDAMEHLKVSIHLRGYAQIKPADAYKEEGYERFNNMMSNIREQTVMALMNLRKCKEEEHAEIQN
ncbi:MAG: preprotein translocase subunit SecA [Solobacterium sp.]|jgi:preprotein translocase subunit SecA|nr:preprotein translocase subunit SecA [Solobacterium sp.]MCH4205790.1 preprotein translocase subunit SecA [Solobacterium sp.]MCH4227314.1 preprotein translocase subunit SecA [Solobacterium sp.]